MKLHDRPSWIQETSKWGGTWGWWIVNQFLMLLSHFKRFSLTMVQTYIWLGGRGSNHGDSHMFPDDPAVSWGRLPKDKDEPFNVTLALNDFLKQCYRLLRLFLCPPALRGRGWEHGDSDTFKDEPEETLEIKWMEILDEPINVTLVLNDSLGQVVRGVRISSFSPRPSRKCFGEYGEGDSFPEETTETWGWRQLDMLLLHLTIPPNKGTDMIVALKNRQTKNSGKS